MEVGKHYHLYTHANGLIKPPRFQKPWRFEIGGFLKEVKKLEKDGSRKTLPHLHPRKRL